MSDLCRAWRIQVDLQVSSCDNYMDAVPFTERMEQVLGVKMWVRHWTYWVWGTRWRGDGLFKILGGQNVKYLLIEYLGEELGK